MTLIAHYLSRRIEFYLSHPTRRNEAAVYLVVVLYVLLAVPWLAAKKNVSV